MIITKDLLTDVQRVHVLAAIKLIDEGYKSAFRDSIAYDLIYLGKKYAPKEVAGLALEVMTGEKFEPKNIRGGENTYCFKALRRCGFTVIRKTNAVAKNSFEADVKNILEYQLVYSSKNTPDMISRGYLIRDSIPGHIIDKIHTLEPIFSRSGFECSIEGSDGVGRKNMSPWVRIFDSEMSKSATEGWYVVIHFSAKGDVFYSTLGCGATKFKNGSLHNVPDEDLQREIDWARNVFKDQGLGQERFRDQVRLNGNKLSRQFEKAIALAKEYEKDSFNESEFWQDLIELCNLLVVIYDCERQGKSPLAEGPIQQIIEEIELVTNPRRNKLSGQGRGLSYPERLAVELRAMEVVRLELVKRAFVNIRDVSSEASYDFCAEKDGIKWIIEVKGTTNNSAGCFLLTAPELKLHLNNLGRSILGVVSDIKLIRTDGNVTGAGGVLSLSVPWEIDHWQFEPTAYRAVLKSQDS